MIEQAPILITGAPRSGSSMIAATINLCGAFGGNMSKRGMYCNDMIHEELVKLRLDKIKTSLNHIPMNWKGEVEMIMRIQGYKGGAWMYKDHNSALIWKTWHSAYPNAKWIIVRRRTGDIIQSCIKTKYMTEHSDEEGWLKLVHMYEEKFVEMITAGLNCKIIWPERMVNGDYQQIYEVCDWLGLSWKEEALDFINSLLWGNKQKRKE